jgi:hypothetical protein
MEKPTLAIYPNPSDGNFRVNMTLENDEADVQLIIYNALGQICYSENLHVSNGDISAEIHLGQNNPAGIYLLKVIDGTSLFTKQILLE